MITPRQHADRKWPSWWEGRAGGAGARLLLLLEHLDRGAAGAVRDDAAGGVVVRLAGAVGLGVHRPPRQRAAAGRAAAGGGKRRLTMACCGQRRAAAVARTAARPASGGRAPASVPRPAATPARASAGVMIRYVERAPIQLLGPRTGRIYRFSGAAPLQLVAAPDVPTLLMMSQFRRA